MTTSPDEPGAVVRLFGGPMLTEIMSVACPACGAQPGRRCPDNPDGRQDVHVKRLERWHHAAAYGQLPEKTQARQE